LEAELGNGVVFVKCDTRSWNDQIELFETAYAESPSRSIDIVIANAGVGRGKGDPLMALEGELSLRDLRRQAGSC
jgi:NAD(P)-dependent dehydrogenase (short-subunit alcohol dehydrogenase family)